MQFIKTIFPLSWLLLAVCLANADPATEPSNTSPTTAPTAAAAAGKLPHLQVDAKQKLVRVDCEAVKADYPLEFLAVVTNTNEYEALVRSEVKPSDLHLALLIIGLKPGTPVHYSESTKTWLPPSGPPVDLWFEYQKDGKTVKIPAYRWMRDVKTHKEAPPMTWVFTGSKLLDDGTYAADATGCLVGVINNELSVLDVPALKSRALEARDYERNADLMPPTGTPVTMILSPAQAGDTPATRPAAESPGIALPPGVAPTTNLSAEPTGSALPPGVTPSTNPTGLSDVHIDQARVDRLRQYWDQKVGPHRDALREAAQAHYQVINDLRKEQQRLIDESDRIQRTIDELEKEYQDMTTPQPEPGK